MNKRIIQAFIVLIVILFGVSLISDINDRVEINNSINEFEQEVGNEDEIENGSIDNVHVFEEDSSNMISNINAKIATILVDGLNKLLGFGLKLIAKIAGE